MRNIGRLLNILKNADDIKNDTINRNDFNDIASRMELIRGITVMELIKEGMPHTFENGVYVIESDGRKYIYDRTEAKGTNTGKKEKDTNVQPESLPEGRSDEPKTVEPVKPETERPKAEVKPEAEIRSDTGYVAEAGHVVQKYVDDAVSPKWSDKEDSTESDKKTGNVAIQAKTDDVPKIMDNGYVDIENDLEESVNEKPEDSYIPEHSIENEKQHEKEDKEPVAKSKESVKDETEPLDEGDEEYPTFLHRDDFNFEYRRIVIRDNMDKKVCSVEFISTPLNPGDPESPALLWTQHGKEAFTITVEPRTRQRIEVENVPFYYIFTYINGEFKSEVDLTNNYKQINYRIQERERQNFTGHKGHIIIADGDIKVHIMPLTFHNNKSNGNAEFMYCIESDGNVLCGETNGADHCEADIKGMTLNLVARWETSSNILYAQVSG